jgi:hypothetical protein
MKRAVLFLALLSSSLPAMPQQLAAVGPVQTAQANPTPEPPPQPPTPPKKPATAAPGEDTGMAGQVAQTEGVVLPTVGAISSAALLGVLAVVAAGVAVSSNSNDEAPASTPSTGTR